ncbi:MAG: type III secretion system cytoplasmic ring protein SctQ [Kistimonas sp.]|nr:type III secretion system cytoplasmic ring protein SctQ [Kistimonas sp.]
MMSQAHSVQPLYYPQLRSQQAQLDNLLLGASLRMETRIGEQPCTLSLAPLMEQRSFDFELQLAVDGLPVRVQWGVGVFEGVAVSGEPLSRLMAVLPDTLRLGCVTRALGRLLSDLRSLLQKDVRLERVTSCEPVDEVTPCLAIHCSGPGYNSTGRMVVTEAIRSLLHSHLATVSPPVVDGLSVPMPVEVGCTTLPQTALGQLMTGDVVLMDRAWYSHGGRLLLRVSESKGFLAHMDGSRITLERMITQGLNKVMSDDFDDFDDLDDLGDLDLGDDFDDDDLLGDGGMTAPPAAAPAAPASAPAAAAPPPAAPAAAAPPPAAAAAPPPAAPARAAAPAQAVSAADVQALPVKLVFDVGVHELTVADMGSLGPGYTFELNRDISSPVIMKANGKPFAACELVSINQRLGARIVKLLQGRA